MKSCYFVSSSILTFILCVFFLNLFFLSALTGYVQRVDEIKKSMTNSANSYFDVQFQVGAQNSKVIRVMVTKGDSSKRPLFLDKCSSEQPIQLCNLRTAPSGTIFMSQSTLLKDFPAHSISFPFEPVSAFTITQICTILDKYTSGTYNVSGVLTWTSSEPHNTPTKYGNLQKRVRDARIADATGSIDLSVWEQHIDEIHDGEFYNISNCRL